MASTAGRKLFVGSLPYGIQDAQLRAEFGRFGQVEDVFIKPGCDPSRQWAFITMAAPDQAQTAKEQCDRILVFPGAERPCDVMVAKNQGMFGQATEAAMTYDPTAAAAAAAYGVPGVPAPALAPPKKIFVGSLPDAIQDAQLRAEYSKFGVVEDVFVKPGCEPGRQWAFVTFTTPEMAQHAQECTNGVLFFPGSMRPCEVTMARNQGLFGKDPIAPGPPPMGAINTAMPPPMPVPAPMTENQMAPKKIFVGSLPVNITESLLSAEFSKYGNILDIHVNHKPSESGRQWAFITFATPDQAALAKVSADRIVFFPGAEKACEVTLAKHQGMFGKDSLESSPHMAPATVQHGQSGYVDPSQPTAYQPKKIFVGSLPETATDQTLRAEFSKYGQVIDVHMNNKACEPGRNWAFITFASSDQAQYAKDSTDRVLVLPGADRACEVMLAKNQGKFGQEPLGAGAAPAVVAPPAAVSYVAPQPQQYMVQAPATQPPPPPTPPPAHLTAWRMYKTAAGLPYYHNSQSGVTQWECPPELQVPGQTSPYVIPQPPAQQQQVRYAPY